MKPKEFSYKENDLEGFANLETIAEANRYNRWMYEVIRKHCSGAILEIGSGIGNISHFFIQENCDITLSDIRPQYCAYLRKKYRDHTDKIIQMNVVDADFDEKYRDLFHRYDTVFALNVVEHIKDDHLAIRNCTRLLKPGGRLIILVPAFQKLYNGFDESLEHYRRYTAKSLSALLSAELSIVHTQYFNAVAIAGWYISGTLLGKKIIPKSQMKLYDRMIPIIRILDKIFQSFVGLSVIAIGKKDVNNEKINQKETPEIHDGKETTI